MQKQKTSKMKEVDLKLSQGSCHCRYDNSGQGPWIILIHGLITPQFAWHFLFDALVQNGYRVVSYDHYGRGESEIPDIDYNFDLYSKQLSEVINFFCLSEKPSLVGWSMGGALASLFAMKHSDRIDKLVLIAPGIIISARHWMKQLLNHNLASILFINIGQKTLEGRLHQQFYNPENYDNYFKRAIIQTKREGFWKSLVSIIINYPENLLKILHYYPDNAPRPLIIWGELDEITDFKDSKIVTKALSGELITFKKASHAVHYEYPDIVNNSIINFLGK